MKRFTIALALAAAFAGTFATRQLLGQGVSRHYIVVFHDDERNTPGLASENARAYGASLSHVYQSALKGYAATIPDGRIDDIRRDPRVAFVSEDRPVQAVGQTVPTGIKRIEADASSHASSNTWSGIAVAVIDTGSGPHADLNVIGGKNCSTGASFSDGNGHGTHVAGTIGAINNGSGVVGVAPGMPIYSVRVLNNQGSGSWSSVACGIDWVTANAVSKNIKVANMSLGGGGAATCRSDVDDTPADFSNFAAAGTADAGHTIAAPGVCINSTWKGGGYSTISGTSMASPHVTGTAALCIGTGNCPGTPGNVIGKLRTDASVQAVSYGFAGDPNHNPTDRYYGYLLRAGGY